MPEAVLWDFDGTLVDTEPLWVGAEQNVLATYGVEWTYEQGSQMSGMSWQESSDIMSAAAQSQLGSPLPVSDWQLYETIFMQVADQIQQTDVPWRAGAKDLLHAIHEAGIKQALISASPQAVLDAGLDRMGRHLFEAVVDGQMVTIGKPHPQGYQMAAKQLNVDPKHAIVIEDSVTGTAAGRRCGAVVLAVPCMQELDEFPRQRIWPSLEGITPDFLSKLWHELKDDPLERGDETE